MASNNIARLGVVLGLDSAQFQADIDKAVAATRGMAQAIKRDSNAAAAELMNLTHATEDYGKTLTKVEQIQREIASGRYMNATQDLKDRLLAQAAAYDKVAAGQNKLNQGLTTQQKIQLNYQITDLVTQIASGQNAMIALMQQGGQLKDSMGGLGNMFRLLTGLLNAKVFAISATAVVVGTLTAAYAKGAYEQAQFRDQMVLVGDRADLLSRNMFHMASVFSDKVGVSVGQARVALTELAATGQFTDVSIDSVTKAVLKFAKISGVDAKDAAEQLRGMFDGTVASATRLNDKYRVLTLEQYKQIEALERAGEKQKAIKVAADAFNDGMDERIRNLGLLERAWNAIGRAINGAWEWLKDFGKEDLRQDKFRLEARLEQVQKRLSRTKNEGDRAELQGLADQLQTRINEIDAKLKDDATKRAQREVEARGISDYQATGGFSGALKRAEELYKQQHANRLQQMMEFADEERKLEIQAAYDIELARAAMKIKNAEESGRLAKDNAKQLAEYEKGVLIKLNQDVRRVRRDQQAEAMAAMVAETDARREALNARLEAEGRAFIANRDALDAEERALQVDRRRAQLRSDMAYASETDKRIAESRLDLEVRIAEVMRRSDLSEGGKQVAVNRLKDMQQVRESFIAFEQSIARMGEKWDSVFNNMASALDTFVRTGKLSFKDLARSIIADLISIEMRAQGKALFGLLKAAMMSGGGYTAEQNIIAGEVGIPMMRASGGTVSAGSPYMVGERGPELFVPGQSGTIIPNNNLASTGGSQTINNYNINAIDVKSFEDRIYGSARAIWAANAYANKSLAVAQGRV